jgi:hypothetical protein
VNVTTRNFNYVLKHVNETPKKLGVTKRVFLNAVLDTLKTPVDIQPQNSTHTLLYSGPIALTEASDGSGEASIIKKMVMRVAINQTNGNLVTAYLTSDKEAVAQNWNTSSWKEIHPNGVSTSPSPWPPSSPQDG